MKTVYLIRHAKSSWEEEGLADFDRPLNERGKIDAPRMGKRLKEKDIVPDLLLSSPAKRALSTAKRIADAIGFPKEKIKTDRALYHADEDEILNVIRSLSDKNDCVILFGHNPGLTDFVNTMNHDRSHYIDNVPTCGVVAFTFQTNSWKHIDFGKGDLILYDYPKSQKD
ncbi:MAG TPA: histidine phosphatase family protein [Chryseosolibacter sp.]